MAALVRADFSLRGFKFASRALQDFKPVFARFRFRRGAGFSKARAALPSAARSSPKVGPDAALADGDVNESLIGGLQGAALTPEVAQATIYTAKNVITMERGAPFAKAIAIAGKRIIAVGSLEEVKAALGDDV